MIEAYNSLGAAQGWQCPICLRVLSPWTMECPCKGRPEWDKSNTDGETYKITLDKAPKYKPLKDYEIKFGKGVLDNG